MSDLIHQQKIFREYQQQCMGYPSVVWQQQMEKATTITYNNTHLYQKSIPTWDPDYSTNFTSRLKPTPLIDYYNSTYIYPDYGRDPYLDTEIYNQDLLQIQHVLDDIELYNKPVHENPMITHNKKTRALKKLANERWHQPSSVPKSPREREYRNFSRSWMKNHSKTSLSPKTVSLTVYHSLPTSTSNARNVSCISQCTLGK